MRAKEIIYEMEATIEREDRAIKRLTKEKEEFIERYKDLLDEAMNRYEHTPNPFMKPVDEYYREELKYLEGLK